MKKILTLLLIVLFSTQACIAQAEDEEDVDSYFTEDSGNVELRGYLEYNESMQEKEPVQLEPAEINKINFTRPKKISSKTQPANMKRPTFQPIQDGLEAASKFSTQEYNIRPVNTSFSQKLGNFSFGTNYDSSLDSASTSHSTSVFSKYEGKYFALGTAFSKSTNLNDPAFDSKIFFIPELKLTKHLSLLDVMQTDVNQIYKKNELVLRYTPHMKKYADEVQFELGAGQSFYEDNYINSSVRFSTRFKL
ncbi:MAG: hypothetical protein WCY19_02400 [Candidatus Gastranaerophilaceae bacterium]